MKHTLTVLLILLGTSVLWAQGGRGDVPVHVGLFNPYAIHTGVKVGATFDMPNAGVKSPRMVYVKPELGYFMLPKNHHSFMISADFGCRFPAKNKPRYMALSAGLGQLTTRKIVGSTIDLNTGAVAKYHWDTRGFLVPTLNVELATAKDQGLNWFTKASYGRKFSLAHENSTFFALELGVRLPVRP